MAEINQDPKAGGNRIQPDDGRDKQGRLPEPLDAAHWPPVEGGPAIILPGMAPGQPAGTGPVLSSPAKDTGALDVDESEAAQGVERTPDEQPPGMRHTQPDPPAKPAEPTGTAKSTTTAKKG
jgi:hypothetical protein